MFSEDQWFRLPGRKQRGPSNEILRPFAFESIPIDKELDLRNRTSKWQLVLVELTSRICPEVTVKIRILKNLSLTDINECLLYRRSKVFPEGAKVMRTLRVSASTHSQGITRGWRYQHRRLLFQLFTSTAIPPLAAAPAPFDLVCRAVKL